MFVNSRSFNTIGMCVNVRILSLPTDGKYTVLHFIKNLLHML